MAIDPNGGGGAMDAAVGCMAVGYGLYQGVRFPLYAGYISLRRGLPKAAYEIQRFGVTLGTEAYEVVLLVRDGAVAGAGAVGRDAIAAYGETCRTFRATGNAICNTADALKEPVSAACGMVGRDLMSAGTETFRSLHAGGSAALQLLEPLQELEVVCYAIGRDLNYGVTEIGKTLHQTASATVDVGQVAGSALEELVHSFQRSFRLLMAEIGRILTTAHEALSTSWESVQEAARILLQGVIRNLEFLADAVLQTLRAIGQGISDFLRPPLLAIYYSLCVLIRNLKSAFGELQRTSRQAIDSLSTLAEALKELAQTLAKITKRNALSLWHTGVQTTQALGASMKDLLEPLSALADTAIAISDRLLQSAADEASRTAQAIANGFSSTADALIEPLSHLPPALARDLSTALHETKRTLTQLTGSAQAAGHLIASLLSTLFQTIARNARILYRELHRTGSQSKTAIVHNIGFSFGNFAAISARSVLRGLRSSSHELLRLGHQASDGMPQDFVVSVIWPIEESAHAARIYWRVNISIPAAARWAQMRALLHARFGIG